MQQKVNPETDYLLTTNPWLIQSTSEMVARVKRECERLRAVIEQSRMLRERWSRSVKE